MADVTRKNENKDEIQDLSKKVSDKEATDVKGGYAPGPPTSKAIPPGPPGSKAIPPGPPNDLAV